MRDTSACCRIEEQGRRDGAQEDHSGGLNKWRSESRPFPPWRRQEPLLAPGLYKGLHKCVVVLLRNTAIQILNIDIEHWYGSCADSFQIFIFHTSGQAWNLLSNRWYRQFVHRVLQGSSIPRKCFLKSCYTILSHGDWVICTCILALAQWRRHGELSSLYFFNTISQCHKLPPDALIYNLKGNERGKASWGKHANCRWALTLILTYWFWIDYLKHCQHQSVKIRALCGGWSNRLCILAQVYRC